MTSATTAELYVTVFNKCICTNARAVWPQSMYISHADDIPASIL